jgi:hypothetical protein
MRLVASGHVPLGGPSATADTSALVIRAHYGQRSQSWGARTFVPAAMHFLRAFLVWR